MTSDERSRLFSLVIFVTLLLLVSASGHLLQSANQVLALQADMASAG